jgi:mannose-1-phosphate guanylyltransferase
MQALVLVGGEGTRLRPLTNTVPKPVVPLVDRPFISYMVDWLAGHGVEEIVFACGFMPDAMREVLGEGQAGGPRLSYVAEPEALGTAGAIKFAGGELRDRFLALNGDVLTDLDLTALMRAHEERDARATLGLYPVEDPSSYGLVRRDSGDAVVEFLEKPGEDGRAAGEAEINAGIYVLERSLLEQIPAGRAVSIEREVFPQLVSNGLYGLRLEGYWMDIGTPDRYLQASWDILEGRVETPLEPRPDAVLTAPDADVAESAEVGPRAVVGPGCRIGPGARIRGSVLLSGCVVGERAEVLGSILAPGVEVGAGGVLREEVVGEGEKVPGG